MHDNQNEPYELANMKNLLDRIWWDGYVERIPDDQVDEIEYETRGRIRNWWIDNVEKDWSRTERLRPG